MKHISHKAGQPVNFKYQTSCTKMADGHKNQLLVSGLHVKKSDYKYDKT
jgi:hypothetical protein